MPAFSSLNRHYLMSNWFFQRTSNSYLKIFFVCNISYFWSRRSTYVLPFPSAPFIIILTLQFISLFHFPYMNFEGLYHPLTLPGFLTSLKLHQMTHSFSLCFWVQVSHLSQSQPHFSGSHSPATDLTLLPWLDPDVHSVLFPVQESEAPLKALFFLQKAHCTHFYSGTPQRLPGQTWFSPGEKKKLK